MESLDCRITQDVLIQRLIQSVNLIELWYKAEKSGQSDVWKKGYFRIYAGGRKQGHVAMGWIFSIPSNPGKLSV